MADRARLGGSPLETVVFPVVVAAAVGLGVLSGAGVVVGSILGATLPGPDGVSRLLAAFPDVGAAWRPPIPSGLVWAGAVAVVAALGPLGRRLFRAGSLHEQGVRWATGADLRRAGLLVPDTVPPHSVPEEPADG